MHVDDFEPPMYGNSNLLFLILACFVQNMICLVNAVFSTVNLSKLYWFAMKLS